VGNTESACRKSSATVARVVLKWGFGGGGGEDEGQEAKQPTENAKATAWRTLEASAFPGEGTARTARAEGGHDVLKGKPSRGSQAISKGCTANKKVGIRPDNNRCKGSAK